MNIQNGVSIRDIQNEDFNDVANCPMEVLRTYICNMYGVTDAFSSADVANLVKGSTVNNDDRKAFLLGLRLAFGVGYNRNYEKAYQWLLVVLRSDYAFSRENTTNNRRNVRLILDKLETFINPDRLDAIQVKATQMRYERDRVLRANGSQPPKSKGFSLYEDPSLNF